MKLELENIGKIEKAAVNLNGLTVIAGENDSGKSTIGKLLFAIVKAFSRYEQDLNESKKNKIFDQIEKIYFNIRRSYTFDEHRIIAKEFYPPQVFREFEPLLEKGSDYEVHKIIDEKLKLISELKYNSKDEGYFDKEKLFKTVSNQFKILADLITKKEEKKEIIKRALNKAFTSEFHFEISPKRGNLKSKVELSEGENRILNIEISKNTIEELEVTDYIFFNDVTFIESPIILQLYDVINSASTLFEFTEKDKRSRISSLYEPKVSLHFKDLVAKLAGSQYFEASLFDDDKNLAILENISQIINGHFSFENEQKDFLFISDKKNKIKSINTASGIKSFGIIQLLLQANILDERSLLIIDEPETHLHPKWQIDYAQIIIELVKNNINILLTTHSPYILQAIKVYSEKADIKDKVNYYLSENNKQNSNSQLIDVTDDLNRLFSKLSEPLQKLVWQ